MTDQQAAPKRPPRSICKVRGCVMYNKPIEYPGDRWKDAPDKVPPTGHPESHYSQFHADPKDVDLRGSNIGVIRPGR